MLKTVFDLEQLDGLHESFQHYGYVRVRNVLGVDELEALKIEIEKIKNGPERLEEGLVWFSPSTNDGLVIQRISRINLYSDLIHKTGHSHPLLVQLAADLLGTDKANFADGTEGSDGSVLVIKDPNNASEHRELRWHRDAKFTQHLPINPFLNLGIYLDDAEKTKGGVVVLPMSHRLNNFDLSYEETTQIHEGELTIEAKSGDIVVHSSEIWHCSRHHHSPEGQRRILYFNYF